MTLGPGMHLSGYEILGLLGAGGMGEVYRAHDPRLNRLVALKVISPDFASNGTWRERFRREARVLATLSHPNIATVYTVEDDRGELVLSMELVEGQSLSELMRTGGMAVERLLKIATQIADAVAAAHDRGITHRDLKPANVIVTVDGRVKVLDFGLAKLAQPSESADMMTGAPSNLTSEGHVVGTPSYMSPEQAEGRPLDYRSDIFSLGILLYEMATGELPFKGQSVLSILSSIVRDTPPPPFEINPRLPKGLSRAIRRCLAKDPEERYQSAKDLRNDLSDLRQELSSGEIAGFEPTRPRHRWRLWLALGTGAAVLAASGWLAGQHFGGEQSAFLPGYISQLTFDPGVEMAPSLSPDGKWVVFARRNANRSDVYLQAVGGENAINLTKDLEGDNAQPAFSPDGERIAFRGQRQGGGLFVMGRTGELVRRVSEAGHNPSWSPDGKWLTYSTNPAGDLPSAHPGGAELWIINIETGEKRRLKAIDALQPAWSPDDKWIAYWGVDPATHQRDLWTISPRDGTPTRVTDDVASNVSPAWSPDGRYLYFSSDRAGTLNLWRVRINGSTGAAQGSSEPVTIPGAYVVHATISRDGKHLAYGSYTWTAGVLAVSFDPSTLEVQGPPVWLVGAQQLLTTARVSPDGTQVVFVRWGQQQDLFVVGANGAGLRRLTSDPLGVRCPDWSPDGTRLAYMRSLQTRGGVQFIDVNSGKVEPLATGDVAGLGCPTWSPDGLRIAIAQGPPNPAAHIFDTTRPGPPVASERLPDAPGGPFTPRSFSPDGRWLAGTVGSRVAIYSLSTRKYEILTDVGAAVGASPTDWLPGGQRLMFMNPRGELMVVDVVTKAVKPVLALPAPQVIRGASVARDGRRVFYAQSQEEGDIWIAALPDQR